MYQAENPGGLIFSHIATRTIFELQGKIGIELYNQTDHHLLVLGFLIGLCSAESIVYHVGKFDKTLNLYELS